MKKYVLMLMGVIFISSCGEKENSASREETTAAEIAISNSSYILAVKDDSPKVGQVIESEMVMDMTDGVIVVTFAGQEVNGTAAFKTVKKRKIESLAEGNLRYTILEDRKTEAMVMQGNAQRKPDAVNPLVGKTVIASKNEANEWVAKLEDGEATPEMKEPLEDIADSLNKQLDAQIYGTEPRKIGDEWLVEGDDLMGMEGATGTFKVKFEGVEDFQGEECAKLTGSIDLKGTPEGEETEGMEMIMKGDFVVYRSLANRVDLQNIVTGKMEMSGDMEPQPGMKMSMKMSGDTRMDGNSKVSSVK